MTEKMDAQYAVIGKRRGKREKNDEKDDGQYAFVRKREGWFPERWWEKMTEKMDAQYAFIK